MARAGRGGHELALLLFDQEVPSAAGGIRVSLGIGMTAFPGDGSTLEQWFRVADPWRHQAKHQGRYRGVAEDSSVS